MLRSFEWKLLYLETTTVVGRCFSISFYLLKLVQSSFSVDGKRNRGNNGDDEGDNIVYNLYCSQMIVSVLNIC